MNVGKRPLEKKKEIHEKEGGNSVVVDILPGASLPIDHGRWSHLNSLRSEKKRVSTGILYKEKGDYQPPRRLTTTSSYCKARATHSPIV